MLFIESNDECMEYFGNVPKEYQEVEYIWTTWTQYIDTWIFPWTNIQVETKITVQSTAQEKTVFWNYKSSSTPSYLYYHLTAYQNAWYFWINNSEWHAWSYSPVIWTQYEIVYNNENNQLSVNWSEVWSVSWTQWQSWSTLYISARWTVNDCYWYYNYYYFKVFNKTTWEYERDFVPCYRKSDWVIWLYDKVSKTFFTNAWSWSFTKWHDVNVKRSEFQKVEYIESSWTQRIDTWYIPNTYTKWEIKLARILNTEYVDFWYYAWNDVQDWRIFIDADWRRCLDIPWWSWYWKRVIWRNWTNWTVVDIEFWNFYIKNLDSWQTYSDTAWTFTGTSTLKFSRNEYSNRNNSDKFYFAKIYDWDTLVRDFIPCYKKSTWEIWMIDDVNKVFYTNDWTWTFTKWWDIN